MYLIKEKSFNSNEPIYMKLSNSDNSMFIPEARVAKDYFSIGFYERGYIDWYEHHEKNNYPAVKLQKEFKTTPEYVELGHIDQYHTGVYLCIGQPIWKMNMKDAIPFSTFGSFDKINDYLKTNKIVLIHLGEGKHKIKKKSEQLACENALKFL
jgi:hypothetical protein